MRSRHLYKPRMTPTLFLLLDAEQTTMDFGMFGRLDHDSLHFIERNLVAGAVVELRRPRRFVGGNSLGVLDGAAVLEVGGDARGPERVAARRRGKGGGRGATLDHPEDVNAASSAVSVKARRLSSAPEQRPGLLVADAGSVEIGIKIRFGVVMGGHLVALAALLVQPHPPALAALVVVLDPHAEPSRRRARRCSTMSADDGAVAEADDRVDVRWSRAVAAPGRR